MEGGGIKRGLTAPEAAALLELPLNQVLTLTIFGLLAKGVVRQVEEAPLQVEVAEEFRAESMPDVNTSKQRLRYYRKVAQEKGTVVHHYEEPFLYLLERNPDKAVKEIDFTGAMELLLKETAAKMKNFDLSDTQDYYRRIVERAWKRAEEIGEIPEQEEFLDKYLPWVMMKDDYPTVLTRRGYNYWPIWMRTPRAAGRPTSSSSGSGRSQSSGPKGVGGRTTAGDVAGSFAGWAENTMGGLAAAILPSSLGGGKVQGRGGVLDLSGVDRTTGDIIKAMMESSKSGGGGGSSGSGCACACAGCACACACAGGGR